MRLRRKRHRDTNRQAGVKADWTVRQSLQNEKWKQMKLGKKDQRNRDCKGEGGRKK